MKNFLRNFVSIIILFYFLSQVDSAKGRECTWRHYCVNLNQCPYLQKELQRLKDLDRRKEFRKHICDFHEGNIFVCCPKLPRKCGFSSAYNKIIGGEDALLGSLPWMAALKYKRPGIADEGFHCCGSIINSRYVLTAAHCLDIVRSGSQLISIHLGEGDLSINPECANGVCYNNIIAGYEKLILHPGFSRSTLQNDIALIRLNLTIDFDVPNVHVAPLCLATHRLNLRHSTEGKPLTIAGWGFTENNSTSPILRTTSVPLVDGQKCEEFFGRRFDAKGKTQICAGGVEGKDTCRGDSGGPLLINKSSDYPYLQVGVVSYGPAPCGIHIPAVYTSVAKFRPWIISNLQP